MEPKIVRSGFLFNVSLNGEQMILSPVTKIVGSSAWAVVTRTKSAGSTIEICIPAGCRNSSNVRTDDRFIDWVRKQCSFGETGEAAIQFQKLLLNVPFVDMFYRASDKTIFTDLRMQRFSDCLIQSNNQRIV